MIVYMSIIDLHKDGDKFVGAMHVEIPQLPSDTHYDIAAIAVPPKLEANSRKVVGLLLSKEQMESVFGALVNGDGEPV